MQRTSDDGQALVETAVVVPLFLFMFLVLLQLMIVAHGRVMLEYAAFNAARAGVVHNGNNQVMRSSAFASMLPIFGDTSTLGHWAETWTKVAALEIVGTTIDQVVHDTFERSITAIFGNTIGGAINGAFPGLELVQVDVVNPTAGDFPTTGDNQDEIDLDWAQQNGAPLDSLGKTRLSIRVRILFPLRIPVADRLLFYAFMAAMYFDAQETNEQHTVDWLNPKLKAKSGGATYDPAKFIGDHDIPTTVDTDRPLQLPSDFLMYQGLKHLPEYGFFVIPLFAYYTMPMESNFYRKNL